MSHRFIRAALVIACVAPLCAAAQRTAPVDRPRRDPMARLPKPEGLAVTQLAATTVQLTWHAVEGAKGYILGRSIGTNGFQRINIPISPQTQYTDSDVRVGIRVSYSVTAVDSSDVAGVRAISADFIPVAMAPEPVASVDSTARDSTRADSSATGGSGAGGGSSSGGSSSGGTPLARSARVNCSLPSMALSADDHRSGLSASPIKVESRFTPPAIALEWRPSTSPRDRISERSGWEIWDQINDAEHFVARVPAGTRRFTITVARAGTHVPMIFPSGDEGFHSPVCGTPVHVSDSMVAVGGSSSGGSAPGNAGPSVSARPDASVEVGAPIQLEVRKAAYITNKTLAQQWISLDPDVASVERGVVIGRGPGEGRIVGITGNADGTVRLNLVRVTVTALPPRHR